MHSKKLVVVVVVSLLSGTGLAACSAVNKMFSEETPKECLQRIPLRGVR